MTVRIVDVTWQERLDSLYNMAAAGGATCPYSVLDEYSTWLHSEERRKGDFYSIEYEDIPDKEWDRFVLWVETEDEE